MLRNWCVGAIYYALDFLFVSSFLRSALQAFAVLFVAAGSVVILLGLNPIAPLTHL